MGGATKDDELSSGIVESGKRGMTGLSKWEGYVESFYKKDGQLET